MERGAAESAAETIGTPPSEPLPIRARLRGGGGSLAEQLAARPAAGAAVATVAVFALFSVWADNFLTTESLATTLTLSAELGIVAMAVTLLMISGEFDLSVGSVLGVSSLLVPYSMTEYSLPVGLAVVVALAAAVTIGLLQGLVVVYGRIPSFIVTLGGLLLWRSVLQVLTEGFSVTVPGDPRLLDFFSYRLGNGFNVSVIWFLVLAVLLSLFLTRTGPGNWIFASGGNERAARSFGVPVDRVRICLFMLTAGAAGLVGVMQAARFTSVDTTRGANLEFEAVAAVVIGGTSLYGGYGSVIGTLLGCLMIGMIRNGLVLAGVSSYWYTGILGLLLVGAVLINRFIARMQARVA
jgi:simple sugar transport system permease protein